MEKLLQSLRASHPLPEVVKQVTLLCKEGEDDQVLAYSSLEFQGNAVSWINSEEEVRSESLLDFHAVCLHETIQLQFAWTQLLTGIENP